MLVNLEQKVKGAKPPVALLNVPQVQWIIKCMYTFPVTWRLHKEFCHNFEWLPLPWQVSTSQLLQIRLYFVLSNLLLTKFVSKFSRLSESAFNKINEESWRICHNSQWTRYETPEDTLSDIFALLSELSKKVSCFLFLLLSCLPLFALQGQLMAGQCWYCRFIILPVEQSYQNIMDHHGIGSLGACNKPW